MKKAVAIGEVRVDYTQAVSEHTIRKQHYLYEKAAQQVRELNKPVVVHCRGGDIEQNATLDCITLKREVLPKAYLIYVVLAASLSQCHLWVQQMVATAKKHHPELIKVVASMDLVRILLEANIVTKYHGQTRNNNPFMVVDVVAEIGVIHHMLTKSMLSTTH